MKKAAAFCTPAGLIIWLIYTLVNRFIVTVPDLLAYPAMIISIILMMIGIVYNGYCFGKKKNPFDFRK